MDTLQHKSLSLVPETERGRNCVATRVNRYRATFDLRNDRLRFCASSRKKQSPPLLAFHFFQLADTRSLTSRCVFGWSLGSKIGRGQFENWIPSALSGVKMA